MIHRCFIYIRWKVSCHFFSRDWRTVILAFRIWTRLANVNIWVNASSYHETAKFPKSTPNIYLSFLVYNQVYNLFVCTLCPCLTSFLQWNWDKPQQNSRSLDMPRAVHERAVLDSIASRKHDTVIISDCVKNYSISNLHVIGMPLNEQTVSFFSYHAVLAIIGLWSPSVSIKPRYVNNVFFLVVCW